MTEQKIKRIIQSEGEVTVAIIHYNTPELTHACIGSLIYNGGMSDRLRIVVFDNSDRHPFPAATGVTVIDNTLGQYVDFEAELAKYPERDRSIGCAKSCEFGSVKHMLSVQKLWELLPDGFILMESDIFIKKPITEFYRREYSFVGYAQKAQPHNPFGIGRVLPMLCWMNVPMFKAEGVDYFDPARTYGLLPGGRENRQNWYDTGASLLEDVISHRPRLKGLHLDIRPYIEHYGSASWQNNDAKAHERWIATMNQYLPTWERRKEIADLWAQRGPVEMEYETQPTYKVAICAIGRLENRYAREWVEHYKRLGVDKIFIYDDNRPEDGEKFADVLHPYIESGLVVIIDELNGKYLQKQAYEDCYNFHSETDWIGFFDFDEFVCIEDGRDIHDFLSDYEGDVVSLNWMTMTDNGLTRYDPRPMAERFTEGTGEDFAINRHVKSFVRTGFDGISFNDPHIPNAPTLQCENVLHERIKQVPVQPKAIHKVAYIKHYNTKTAEEWATVKMKRLAPCGEVYNQKMLAGNVDYFFSINERTPEKEAILGVKQPEPKAESKPKTKKRTNSKVK